MAFMSSFAIVSSTSLASRWVLSSAIRSVLDGSLSSVFVVGRRSPTTVAIVSRLPVTSYSASRTTVRFFGSSMSARWKSAVCLNESVSVSSSRADGVASASSDETGIERSLTAGSTLRVQASRSWSRSAVGTEARRAGASVSGRCRARRGRGNGEGPHDSAAGGPACTRDSSTSSRWASESRERSAWGRVILTSASSSGSRGSPPWRMSSTATASRSIRRSDGRLGQLVRLLAQPLAGLLGDGQRLGHVADVLHEQELAEVLDQLA